MLARSSTFLYLAKQGTGIANMRKEQFVEGEYYHIYSRGVEKRAIFTTDRENLRFIHTLYILNNFVGIPPRFNILALEPRELLTPVEPYVEIVAGCLMPNHYHLMLTPKRKNGVSLFLHKFGSAYAHYFNRLHERTGRLFESSFKAKHVGRHEYATYLTQYIHLNPADLYLAKQGTEGEDILARVESYQWSSLPVYIGQKCPLSLVVTERFRNDVLDMSADEYRRFLRELYDGLYRI